MVVEGFSAADKGMMNGFRARWVAEEAKGCHHVAVHNIVDVQRATQETAEDYGRCQLSAQRDAIGS